MAADKSKPTRAKKPPKAKGSLRGRMPTKRSINLMVVDENKINPLTAIPAVLAILVLAALFGKFLVMDRIVAVGVASGKASRLKAQLAEAKALAESFGDIEGDYAHYTIENMSYGELDQVDRNAVLELVGSILPPSKVDMLNLSVLDLFRQRPEALVGQEDPIDRLLALPAILPEWGYVINSWSVSGNLLTLEVTGDTLERLNELAHTMEQNPIVNSCAISTANKSERTATAAEQLVKARLIAYLQQPPEEVAEP